MNYEHENFYQATNSTDSEGWVHCIAEKDKADLVIVTQAAFLYPRYSISFVNPPDKTLAASAMGWLE